MAGKVLEVVRSDHSETFKTFRRAILDRRQITCTYKGAYREICPHILGHTKGEEQALVFQFAGESTTSLPPGGEWRCLQLSEVQTAEIRDGRWHSGMRHRTAQTCVELSISTSTPPSPTSQAGDEAV